MAEYIEREAAKACVKEHYDDAIVIAIDKLPAADVRPVVRGKWSVLCEYVSISENRRRKTNVKTWMCSNCFVSNGRRKTNFCPSCGAKMEES